MARGGESKQGLVVTLVFFILATIGAGVAAYYGFSEQEKLRGEVKKEQEKTKASDDERDWYMFQVGVLRSYLGFAAPPDSRVGRELPSKKGAFDQGSLGTKYPDHAQVRDMLAKLGQRSAWDPATNQPKES